MNDLGHNSGAGALAAFVERIDALNEEITIANSDKKKVYSEARHAGFDPKIIKKVIAIRDADRAKASEEQALIDIYCRELGIDQ